MPQWDDRHEFLREEARLDLEDCGEARPCLLAFAGPNPLLIAFLREFDKGEHLDALIEVLALVMPLGADRLALSISGRAWSLDDPVPPVVPGVGDLRQRMLIVQEADGSRGRPRLSSTGYAFDVVDGRVEWGESLSTEEETGPLVRILGISVAKRGRLRATDHQLREQAERCVDLGHMILAATPVLTRLCR